MVFNTGRSGLLVQDTEQIAVMLQQQSANRPDGGTFENRLVGTNELIQR